MHQIPELDNLNHFRSLIENDLSLFAIEKGSLLTDYSFNNFAFTQRRERIDSEDFSLPVSSKTRPEIDIFMQEVTSLPANQPEEPRVRRKSSTIAIIDPTLMELEVSLKALYLKYVQPTAKREASEQHRQDEENP